MYGETAWKGSTTLHFFLLPMQNEIKPKIPSAAKQTEKQYVYTRDFLLGLFSTDYPLPEDADTSLSAFVAEPRPPLANLPLSDLEKRLLSMVSINSDSNRRNYRDQKKRTDKIAPGMFIFAWLHRAELTV
jgi:hypothetical protein